MTNNIRESPCRENVSGLPYFIHRLFLWLASMTLFPSNLTSACQVDYQLVGAKKVGNGHWESRGVVTGAIQVPQEIWHRDYPMIGKPPQNPNWCQAVSQYNQDKFQWTKKLLCDFFLDTHPFRIPTFPRHRCNKPSQDLEQLKGEGVFFFFF